jgi:hypothetical protein
LEPVVELARHGPILKHLDLCTTEDQLAKANRIKFRQGGKQAWKVVVANPNVQKFVRIVDHDPARLTKLTLEGSLFESDILDRLIKLLDHDRVGQMPDQPHLVQPIPRVIGAVITIVGHDDELGNANAFVKRRPFQQARPFVLHAGHAGEDENVFIFFGHDLTSACFAVLAPV